MKQSIMTRNRTRYTLRIDNRVYEITVNSRTKHCGLRYRENSDNPMSMPIGLACFADSVIIATFLTSKRTLPVLEQLRALTECAQ